MRICHVKAFVWWETGARKWQRKNMLTAKLTLIVAAGDPESTMIVHENPGAVVTRYFKLSTNTMP